MSITHKQQTMHFRSPLQALHHLMFNIGTISLLENSVCPIFIDYNATLQTYHISAIHISALQMETDHVHLTR